MGSAGDVIIDQRLRDIQLEYLKFLEDEVSRNVFNQDGHNVPFHPLSCNKYKLTKMNLFCYFRKMLDYIPIK